MPFSFGKLRVLLLLTCTLTRSIYRNVLFKIYILFDMSNSRNFVVGNIAQVRKSPMRSNDTIFRRQSFVVVGFVILHVPI